MIDRPHQLQIRRTRTSGYTMVELCLVIAIIGILSGIAIPRYGRGTNRYRVEAAAKRVAADFRQAQQRARSASGPCSITFSTATGSYSMTYPTVGGTAGRVVKTDLSLPPYLSRITSAAFGSTGATISFSGYGMPTSGGTIVVTSGAEQRTVTLSAGSGAIAIN